MTRKDGDAADGLRLPLTTLFLLMSLDGKISTGPTGDRDFDRDLPLIPGICDGLAQYYQLERETDLVSFITGKVLAKVGWNEPKERIDPAPVAFVVVDNAPHLTSLGLRNLLRLCSRLVVVTTNAGHPAFGIPDPKLVTRYYNPKIDFVNLFGSLQHEGVDRLTVQSGGQLNAVLLRAGLIDRVSVTVAPLLVGGGDTPTLVDGPGAPPGSHLVQLPRLRLVKATPLAHSYLHLEYDVIDSLAARTAAGPE